MKLLFVADALSEFKTQKDSTYAMMAQAYSRGYRLFVCQPLHLASVGDAVVTTADEIELVGDVDDLQRTTWFRIRQTSEYALQDFDAVLMRKDPPFDMEYVTATWLLERAQQRGAKVFNDPRSIRDHSEKLAITEFPQWIAPTLVTRDFARLHAFHEQYREVIIKPLDGMGGMGIFKVGADALNLNAVIEMLTQQGTRTIMMQQFIPEVKAGDKRILLIGGQVVPYALARIPQGKDIRGNLAAGGVGRAQPLSQEDKRLAEALAPILVKRGLLLVGLDVIGRYLTEINVTSPTCFREITEQTGLNVAGLWLDALEKMIRAA